MDATTPAMRQYAKAKAKYPDCIVLFRMGDFYETFAGDAKTVAAELDITLTSRRHGKGGKIPLAGVPWHALDTYLHRLVKKGYKVAICEQVEDPKLAKGVVKREVVRVVTPGTIIEPELLDGKHNNYLLGLVRGKASYGIAYADLSTGEFYTTQLDGEDADNKLTTELARIKPAECILPDVLYTDKDFMAFLKNNFDDLVIHSCETHSFDAELAYGVLTAHFGTSTLEGFGCEHLPLAISAAGGVFDYIKDTQKSNLPYLNELTTYTIANYMVLDATTIRNLELVRNVHDGTTKNTLLMVLDQTYTAMGSRLLRKWLLQPLINVESITQRSDAVELFHDQTFLRHDVRKLLRKMGDIERLINKTVSGSANPRDIIALKESLARVPELKALLHSHKSGCEVLVRLESELSELNELVELADRALVDEPPIILSSGGIIRDGYDDGLDELRDIAREGKSWIATLENDERARTGIKSLKIGYNKVFGYYIEVTKPHISKVPPTYIRKQTLVNAERYITPELKDKEALVLSADERMVALEQELFAGIREEFAVKAARILKVAHAIAELDVLTSFAEVAVKNVYVKPEVDYTDRLSIKAGRHPVVEMSVDNYVPNDALLDCSGNQVLIITGPNMSGKSTFMRQVALIAILAQIGSFVPAKYAAIGMLDRVFTRVGAFDDLVHGQSTFMVEMVELANILHSATQRSLILLDEIGRGTSTFDGLSIAWAVAEYVHNKSKIGSKTLLATHYHQLTDLASILRRVKNYHIAVKEAGDDVVFLRKLVPGGTDKSYGIYVAKLAGVPREVIKRASEILAQIDLAKVDIIGDKAKSKGKMPRYTQLMFPTDLGAATARHPVLEQLTELDVTKLTPIEALVKLEELQKRLKKAGNPSGLPSP